MLTPPLSDSFDWSISLPVFGGDEAPVSQLGIAPVNTAAPSPWAEDNDAAPECGEPLQLTWDIYSGPPAPGSDADRQQRLRAELRDSLHLREFSPEIGQWSGASGPKSPHAVKRPALDEVAMCASPKKARTCPKIWLTHYYCSKCHVDNADHSYEQCPTWKFCGFCDKVGHWGFHCSTPHVKCMRLRCGVYVGHRHIGKMCPWSRETKVDNFRYSCDGQVADLPHVMVIYGEELDWSSYGLAI